MLLSLVGLALTMTDANAQEQPDDAFTIFVGTTSRFENDPATFRLSLRGEMGIGGTEAVFASLLIPLTLTTPGPGGDGFDLSQTLFELPVSIRGRILSSDKVRVYGDAGVGLTFGTAGLEALTGNDTVVAPLFRTALGVEIGNPEAWAIVVEPVAWEGVLSGGDVASRFGAGVGFNVPL